MAGSGEDGAQRTSDSKERKQATPQDAYYKFERKCEYMGIKFRKGDYISRDELHHEWEWFGKNKLHKGAVEPIDGGLYKEPDLGRIIRIK